MMAVRLHFTLSATQGVYWAIPTTGALLPTGPPRPVTKSPPHQSGFPSGFSVNMDSRLKNVAKDNAQLDWRRRHFNLSTGGLFLHYPSQFKKMIVTITTNTTELTTNNLSLLLSL